MNNDTTIGQNVRRYRRAANLTQQELADHLSLSYQQIQKYEYGTNRIAAGRIPHIATFLGCEIMDLFEGTEGKGYLSVTTATPRPALITCICS